MDVVANALCMCNARAHNNGTHDNVRVNPFVRVRAGKRIAEHTHVGVIKLFGGGLKLFRLLVL